ncbi:hypothetical protein OQ614_26955, partial [Klebsiella pneumoniae]|uniref:hypothetical protein n=1 Tax=Klebsiella pneumoniae TaxID=573 RepID=UPI0022486903
MNLLNMDLKLSQSDQVAKESRLLMPSKGALKEGYAMHMPSPNTVAPAQGLYQPDEFKDNCGFGLIAHM